MKSEGIGLSGRCGFTLLAVATLALPIPLLAKAISVEVFSAVGLPWLLVSGALIFGDSITVISFGKAKIKRETAKAIEASKNAEKALKEAELIRDQLRVIARVTVENTYLMSGHIMGITHVLSKEAGEAFKGSPEGLRINENMNLAWKFVEPDSEKAEQLRLQFLKDMKLDQSVSAREPHPQDPA